MLYRFAFPCLQPCYCKAVCVADPGSDPQQLIAQWSLESQHLAQAAENTDSVKSISQLKFVFQTFVEFMCMF